MFKLLIALLIVSNLNLEAGVNREVWNLPSSDLVGESFESAYSNPHFYYTAAAGLLSLIIFDGEVSREASKKSPIFGSVNNADNTSDLLVMSLIPMLIYTNYSTRPTDEGKTPHMMMLNTALVSNILLVGLLKLNTGRERPDMSDTNSLPSGHASLSSAMANMIHRNVLNSKQARTSTGKALRYGSLAISGMVAWARVEAEKHHLSDVLFGHAVGVFVSDFFYDMFIEDGSSTVRSAHNINFDLLPNKYSLNYSYSF